MMEFEIGITDDELKSCFSSYEPNDQAFVATFAALIQGWRDGKAQAYLNAARSLANEQSLIEVRLLKPSLN